MNDLDDDLFGSLIKPKSKQTPSGNDKLQHDKRKTKFKEFEPANVNETIASTRNRVGGRNDMLRIDFDDDDPLAGLLPDDDDDLPPKTRGSNDSQGKSASRTLPEKTKVPSESETLLPDSPPPRRRNILDDLMAKSDVARTVEKTEEPAKSGFVLGDQYRTSKPAQDNGAQFGSYVPSADQRPRSGMRRPGTGASSTDNDFLGILTDNSPTSRGPQTRPTGRRGISPTIEPPKSDTASVSSLQLQTTPAQQLPRSRSTDWLELKDDAPTRTTQAIKSAEKPEGGLRRRDREDSRPPTAPASISRDTDWLGAEDKIPLAEPETSGKTAKETPKTDNFMDWLGSKTKEAKKPEEKVREDSKPNSRRGSFADKQIPLSKKLEGTPDSLPPPVQDIAWANSDVPAARLEYEGRLSTIRTQMADIHTKFSEESLAAAASLLDLQTKARRLQFERDQLSNAFDGLELRHKEELQALETSFKKRTQLIEESYQRREQRLHEELDFISQSQVEKQRAWENERSEIVANWQRRVDEATQYRMEDLEKIKELHRNTVGDMKRDHEFAIARLQQIKKIEVDAMSEAQSHSKTLHSVIEQLQSNTTELSQLQFKVEGGHLAGVEERTILLDTKDKQLTMLQGQLKKQREDNEQERLNLRQLITRLEDKLHQQTLGLEEERWKITQDRNRLDVEQRAAVESQKLSVEKLDKERLLLQKSKDAFLEEQKMVMQQIYSEKAGVYSSMNEQDFSLQMPQKLSLASPLYDLQVKTEFESSLRCFESEKNRFVAKQRQLTSELQQLEKERLLLEKQQEELDEEKSAMNELAVQVKQRSEEVEEMCLAAVHTREEGFAALQEASRIAAEIQSRQDNLKVRFEELATREQNLAEERLRLAQVRKELEYLRSKLLCVQCQTPVSSSGNVWLSKAPGLSAWQMDAERDKEFLQQESLFLESLRLPLQGDFYASMLS